MKTQTEYLRGNKFYKLALVMMVLVFCFIDVLVLATEKDTNVNTNTSALSSNKEVISQVLEVPNLLQPAVAESEKAKLHRLAQVIKEKKPQLFKTNVPPKTIAFCIKFMEDLLTTQNIEAIEPDFVTESEDEVTKKLTLQHCEDVEHGSIISPDANPMLYSRGSLGFNFVSELGGPPYRFYKIQLLQSKKAKYPILYYNSHEGAEHTGFARLDLKKCEIMDEAQARSEISTSFQFGRNVLVKYKGQIFALTLDYDRRYPISYSPLELKHFDIPITKGIDNCSWPIIRDDKVINSNVNK
jgi:hypothetical protein